MIVLLLILLLYQLPQLPVHHRFDWLRPDLDLTFNSYNLGTSFHVWGEEGFQNIYIEAPRTMLIVHVNGKYVSISRKELEERAK